MREADLDDLRTSVDELKSLNPTNMIRDELTKLAEPVNSTVTEAQGHMREIEAIRLDEPTPPAPVTVDAAEAAPPPAPIETADSAHVEVPEPMRLEGVPDFSVAAAPVAPPEPEPAPAGPSHPAPQKEMDAKA
jgi:sec-independent protein translocase protein TatB